jgi:hypothetical protein
LEGLLKDLQECLYFNLCGISSPLVSDSFNFFSYEDLENTEEKPEDPEPADEGDIQMEYSSD